jgi:hypothetical protein
MDGSGSVVTVPHEASEEELKIATHGVLLIIDDRLRVLDI